MRVVLLLVGLPLPVLLILVVAFAFLFALFQLLIAFVPQMAERVVTIIKAYRAK